MKCWEFKKCGREKGGARTGELGVCPAWPDAGESCAHVAGTLCGGQVQGTFAVKLSNCMQCPFYNSADYVHRPAAAVKTVPKDALLARIERRLTR